MEITLQHIDTQNFPPQENNKCVFGTHEWAKHNANFINGCEHDCKYCYSKEMAIRFQRKTPTNWQDEEIREKTYLRGFRKLDGTIMFPSSHDIHPNHLKETIRYLRKILHCGNSVLIVSKPHRICIKEICRYLHALATFSEKIELTVYAC